VSLALNVKIPFYVGQLCCLSPSPQSEEYFCKFCCRCASSSSSASSSSDGEKEPGQESKDDEDGSWGAEREGEFADELEVDPMYADILQSIRRRPGEDPLQEGLTLGRAYEEMRARHMKEQERRKIMRKTVAEVEEKMQPLGALVAFMASASLNKYNTLRYIITYQAHKPFSYRDPHTQKDVVVEPQLCSRVVFKCDAETQLPDGSLFKWTKAQLKDPLLKEAQEAAIEAFSQQLLTELEGLGKPLPQKVVFVSDLKHGRGNNFLLIHHSAEAAAAVRCQDLGVLGFPVKIHGVVNRRSKLRLSRGISVPQFLPTKEDAAAQAYAMTEHILGYFVDRITPPWHMCAGGDRVLSEQAVRLKELPPSVDEAQIREWVGSEVGLFPSKVLKDNLARNSMAALAGSASSQVTWILEFDGKEDCEEKERDVQKALLLHNRTLQVAFVKVERIRRRGAGEFLVQLGVLCCFHSAIQVSALFQFVSFDSFFWFGFPENPKLPVLQAPVRQMLSAESVCLLWTFRDWSGICTEWYGRLLISAGGCARLLQFADISRAPWTEERYDDVSRSLPTFTEVC
jgi:hypothetical protein